MEIKFSKLFEKDLKGIATKSLVLKVDAIILELQLANSLGDIKSIKQLKGHKNCFRIRIGDFRLGIVSEGKSIWLARLMHRREIYRYFP